MLAFGDGRIISMRPIAYCVGLLLSSTACAQEHAPCRDNAADLLVNVPMIRLDRMEKKEIHYIVDRGKVSVIAQCDWTKLTAVRSFIVTDGSSADAHRRAAELITSLHTGEPADAISKLISRCMARATALRRPFQVVGKTTTMVCGHNPRDVAIYRREQGDVEN